MQDLSQADKERRCQLLYFSDEFLFWMICDLSAGAEMTVRKPGEQEYTVKVVENSLPADAKLSRRGSVRVAYDIGRACFAMRICSAEFEPVAEGERLPEHASIVVKREEYRESVKMEALGVNENCACSLLEWEPEDYALQHHPDCPVKS